MYANIKNGILWVLVISCQTSECCISKSSLFINKFLSFFIRKKDHIRLWKKLYKRLMIYIGKIVFILEGTIVIGVNISL